MNSKMPMMQFGLITYTDIVKTVIAEGGDIDLLNVYDVCAKPAISVGENLALETCCGADDSTNILNVYWF
ncbi:hypothetical protein ACT691_18445 [Vibrio metschnikovii]